MIAEVGAEVPKALEELGVIKLLNDFINKLFIGSQGMLDCQLRCSCRQLCLQEEVNGLGQVAVTFADFSRFFFLIR